MYNYLTHKEQTFMQGKVRVEESNIAMCDSLVKLFRKINQAKMTRRNGKSII